MSGGRGLTPPQLAEVRRLAAADQKIAAIKLFRELTGVGLAEAKAAVEAFEREGKRSAAPHAASQHQPADRAALAARARDAALAGRTLEAVKLYRTAHGVQLFEAKLAADLMLALPDRPPPAPELVRRVGDLIAQGRRQDAAVELANGFGLDPQRAEELTGRLGGGGCRRAVTLLAAAALLALAALVGLLLE
ncbi:MAG: ribosomal protein L7/L12 [Vicinamibacteria bacterium]